MDINEFIKNEFLYTASDLPSDFIQGQERDILRHFLGDGIYRLKPHTRGLFARWVCDNWQNYIKFESVASPYQRLKGYAIYTPFEIFVDADSVPESIDTRDYEIKDGYAVINTGYDCLVVDFSGVNFAAVLKKIK